ncbi:MAG: Zn-dependent oligopeptidase [Bdellovibrionales bacterium]|nr:Zn-dependent oligopeptidase [Bdellovibrionales bacterium]
MKILYSCIFMVTSFLVITCSGNNNVVAGRGATNTGERMHDLTQLNFSYSPDEIRNICNQEQDRVNAGIDAVAAVDLSTVNFDTGILALETVLAEFSTSLEPVNFLKYVSADADVRDAADECEQAIAKLYVDIFAREDLYKVVKACEAKSQNLGTVQKRLVTEYLEEFQRNGLELPLEKRKKFIEKKKKLVELTTEFDKNLVEWKDSLAVSREELDGMPDDYIKGLEKTEDGKYKVGLSYPEYFPFMQNAKNADARRRLQIKFFNRGGDRNTELLETAIRLRHESAQLLGKKDHATFVLEQRMAKEPETVLAFLNDLIAKLKPKGESDLAELLELKRKDEPGAAEILPWDWRYYDNQLKKEKYQVDHQKIKEYFPLATVNKGMFEIYETLLDVDFVEDPDAPRWHDSVLAYKVVDNKTKKHVASFYMDLFPRQGKYGHAAAFTLVSGYTRPDGSYQRPVSSIVANFNAPQEGQPSLLTHNEVETHFHEFGHIMHQVLTTAPYTTFSGTRVKRDFVEAPSQMLENWVWNKASLSKLSGHYLRPSETLPDELLDSLLKAKLADAGILYLRQLFFGMLDMTYHTSASVNSTAIYEKLQKEIMLIAMPPGTQPQASFGHLMGGYDAGYYGYLWSEVFAQDMFTRFENEGLLNPATGADYRHWILEKGGTQDPSDLIRGFLGREPNNLAFLRSLGLNAR